MGRRSRTRAKAAGLPRAPRAAAGPGKAAGRATLGPVRRTLALTLAGAAVVAVLTLLGIVVLGGSLGPFITLAGVVVLAGLVHRASRARLAGVAIADDDRVIQTLAVGLLVLCVALAAANAAIATVA